MLVFAVVTVVPVCASGNCAGPAHADMTNPSMGSASCGAKRILFTTMSPEIQTSPRYQSRPVRSVRKRTYVRRCDTSGCWAQGFADLIKKDFAEIERKCVRRDRVARRKVAYPMRPELDCGTYWPRTQREFLSLSTLAENRAIPISVTVPPMTATTMRLATRRFGASRGQERRLC